MKFIPMSCRLSLLLACLSAPGVAWSAADTCTPGAATPDAITSQRMLDALVATNGVPGMGAAVWRDGEVVWTGCSGLRDVAAGQPVTRDTVFRFASVSKPLAATAVAKLAEQGRLDLDAPVTTLLPWLRNAWQPITVRQLAAHASGLPHYQPGDEDVGRRHYGDGRAAVRIFIDRPLLSAPGSSYSYSSWGYTLMGAVVEQVSGQPFPDYVTQHIAPGLAIQADTAGRGERDSALYELRDGAAVPVQGVDFSYTWPGGGLAGTPESLVRFAGRLMQGQLVSESTWRGMRVPLRLSTGEQAGERDYAVGLGWRMGNDERGRPIAHHAGTTQGARSALVLWPMDGLAASVLSNAQWVSSIEQTARVLALPHRPRLDSHVAAACPVHATRYRGQLGAKRFQGQMTLRISDGRCVGELAATPELQAHFSQAYAWPGGVLRVIAIDSDGLLVHAALATPYGLYELRATAPGRWSAKLDDKTTLELAL